MKVLLINPPLTVFKGGANPRVYMPLGLLYIAAQLEQTGHRVVLFDALIKAGRAETADAGRWHFGATADEIAQAISRARPQVVGITSMFSSQAGNVKMVAALTKQVSPDIYTVVGGPHPSANPAEPLADSDIDFAIIGEGEFTLPRLLAALGRGDDLKNIAGLCARRPEEISNCTPERITDLDSLSFPAYHLYDMERYFFLQNHGFCARPAGSGRREISMITSRGCPYNCVFCAIHPVMGRSWRAHSAEYVLRHIEFLRENYHIDFIHFEDDNFALHRQRFEQILDGISIRKLNINWEPANGLRADYLDAALIQKARRAGCRNITIAVESGAQRVLAQVINKKLNLDRVIAVAKICKKLKMELYAYYLIGLPGETREEIRATLEFARRMFLRYFVVPQISFAAPIWGSRLYAIAEAGRYLTAAVTPERLAVAYDSHGEGLIGTKEFSPPQLKRLLAHYNRLFLAIGIFNILRRPRKLILYAIALRRNPHLLKRLAMNW